MAVIKKVILAQDNLLKLVLLDKSEHPYEVPQNWIWTKLKHVAKWGSGGTPSRRILEYYTGSIPWIKTGELKNNFIYDTEEKISEIAIVKSSAKLFPINTIVIAMYGATIGKVGIMGVASATNQACACAVANATLNYRYLFFYLLAQQETFIKLGRGGAQPNISQEIIKEHEIPIPPIAEQERIVKIIESLFKKLNASKELAKNALESFECRKAAILHKTFSGELTKEWRDENGVSLESWGIKKFDEVAIVKSNLVNPKNYLSSPHIAPANIEKKTGRLLKFNTIEQDGVKSVKHLFYEGQILYSKIRPYLSKVVLIDFDGLCSADMYPIETKLFTKYLWYFMLSDDFVMAASSAGSRSVLPKINVKELSQLAIIVPSYSEQKEIVRILDSLFEKEERAKELCDVIEKIVLIKEIILARAFRSELGTNNSQEECVSELLKKELAEKIYLKHNPIERIAKVSIIEEVFEMPKDILELLQSNKKMTPEQLKKLSGLEVGDFYEALKKYIDDSKIQEIRDGRDIFLEVKDEDR